MGLLDGMLGNASKVDNASVQDEFAQLLAPGERVEHAYKLIRDFFVFTNKRLVVVDKQGLTGSKVQYHSIPYRSITHFSVETAGTFDLEAELKIWISSTAAPLSKTFNKKLSIYEVQAVLASYVMPPANRRHWRARVRTPRPPPDPRRDRTRFRSAPLP